MPKMIFVNLPVTELSNSIAFYTAIGGSRNPQFSDDTAACMVLSESIHVMLLTHAKYSTFTTRPIANTHATSASLLALTFDSRDEVNATLDLAVAAGGLADPNPQQDLGFMFSRSVQDPDGHVWEIFWMDPTALATT
ncbi:VOC family protein [Undibacterium fentianense]|uniref:VOC family protein n=1 Tax=Undibacterium fentianense TaxID=2828728 RepID=A0A941IE44_9BURK|nr:VOC family protein [Undibacterium fentianense]MBR7799246.1 VOC family protein [Undibacterium fentianense]